MSNQRDFPASLADLISEPYGSDEETSASSSVVLLRRPSSEHWEASQEERPASPDFPKYSPTSPEHRSPSPAAFWALEQPSYSGSPKHQPASPSLSPERQSPFPRYSPTSPVQSPAASPSPADVENGPRAASPVFETSPTLSPKYNEWPEGYQTPTYVGLSPVDYPNSPTYCTRSPSNPLASPTYCTMSPGSPHSPTYSYTSPGHSSPDSEDSHRPRYAPIEPRKYTRLPPPIQRTAPNTQMSAHILAIKERLARKRAAAEEAEQPPPLKRIPDVQTEMDEFVKYLIS